jgi:hypothetical protein
MKDIVKKFIPVLPKKFRLFLLSAYESFYAKKVYKFYKNTNTQTSGEIKNILFYHPSALSFAGTEKFLQIIAKHINKEKYNIFLMHEEDKSERKYYLEDEKITFIPFSYTKKQKVYPYTIEGMQPSIYEIISKHSIDLLITAGSGYSEFPFNSIKDIPIFMLNIFGSPSAQKNIVKHFCISKEVAEKVEMYVPSEKIEITYIPSEKPSDQHDHAKEIRERFGIKDTDMVFGRIGRASDAIFDPIGIRAFQKVVRNFPNAHYIIMSTPPIIKKIVEEDNIPNVHFLENSSKESDVWGFHQAIDALAHFRNDGESCGLNIIESLLCANPVITHKSHIWNAHLEYLDIAFSRVAEKGDIEQYKKYMEELILLKQTEGLSKMGSLAKKRAEELFLAETAVSKIESAITELKHD